MQGHEQPSLRLYSQQLHDEHHQGCLGTSPSLCTVPPSQTSAHHLPTGTTLIAKDPISPDNTAIKLMRLFCLER